MSSHTSETRRSVHQTHQRSPLAGPCSYHFPLFIFVTCQARNSCSQPPLATDLAHRTPHKQESDFTASRLPPLLTGARGGGACSRQGGGPTRAWSWDLPAARERGSSTGTARDDSKHDCTHKT